MHIDQGFLGASTGGIAPASAQWTAATLVSALVVEVDGLGFAWGFCEFVGLAHGTCVPVEQVAYTGFDFLLQRPCGFRSFEIRKLIVRSEVNLSALNKWRISRSVNASPTIIRTGPKAH